MLISFSDNLLCATYRNQFHQGFSQMSSSFDEMNDEHLSPNIAHDESAQVCDMEQLLDLEMSQDTLRLKKLLSDLSASSEKHLSGSGM